MGKKDEYQFDYLDDNGRFADQINGALFNGRQVVKPEELEPDEPQIVSTGERTGTGSISEYSCAMKSHFRKSGNQMSGKWKSSYASLLA